MRPSVKSLGIDQLSLAERLLLVEEIWDSIVAEAERTAVPDTHKQELDRRLVALRAEPHAGASWQDVKALLEGRSRLAP